MKLIIEHYTRYAYSAEVGLNPQHLYFLPAPRNHFKLSDFQLDINPKPQGIYHGLDSESNRYHQVWFREPTQEMVIDVRIELQVKEMNPFQFVMEKVQRNAFCQVYAQGGQTSAIMDNWAGQIREQSTDPLDFLIRLGGEIAENWKHHVRYEENLHTPQECFDVRSGSCRDLSWMMIHLLRGQGYPARFVSGYAFNPELEDGHELHAWVEAWLDGPGWVGIDPSAGMVVNHCYVPTVASADPLKTFPVQGTYRGAATSQLDFQVQIRATGKP